MENLRVRRQSMRRLRRARRRLLLALALAVVSAVRLVGCPRLFLPDANPSAADAIVPETAEADAETGNVMEPMPLVIDAADIAGTDDSLMAPYGTKVLRISDEGTQVYWKKIEGASGYEVARSYHVDSVPEHLAYVTKGSFTFTDANFNHDVGKVYYFVRGLSGEGPYAVGPWSKPIEASFVSELTLSREVWYLPRGDSYQFEASYGWGNVADAQWSSSDEQVATIDAKGLLSAESSGTVQVQCVSKTLGQSAEATVTVDRQAEPMLAKYTPRYVQESDGTWTNPDAGEARDAVIAMVGDLMCMGPQLTSHYSEEGGYDFNECYRYVKPIFEESDLAVGNLETLLASAYPYSGEAGYINGKPVCNAPARYLDALRYGGLDVLCLANNHNADLGTRAAGMTLAQVERYRFAHTGLFSSEDEERTLLVDVRGIKVGFVSYVDATCGFNGQERTWSERDRETLLNAYSPERAATDIARLRQRGAEYVIAYLHWGIKNNFSPVEGQELTARELADAGVDYIVGSHPHLVQRYEELHTSDGRSVPCIYSVGDFNSYIHQVKGNLDSVLMRIRLHRTKNGRVILAENAYVPCHIYRHYGEESFVTMPMDKALNGGADMPAMRAILERISMQVGEELPRYEP